MFVITLLLFLHLISFNSCYWFLTSFIYLIFFLKFVREYTSKVDELVKDKIEAQSEVKAKEREEKELVAQQVWLFSFCVIKDAFYPPENCGFWCIFWSCNIYANMAS